MAIVVDVFVAVCCILDIMVRVNDIPGARSVEIVDALCSQVSTSKSYYQHATSTFNDQIQIH
jgi:hypothetical protein